MSNQALTWFVSFELLTGLLVAHLAVYGDRSASEADRFHANFDDVSRTGLSSIFGKIIKLSMAVSAGVHIRTTFLTNNISNDTRMQKYLIQKCH